jgi:predicted dienelactone hydrolase
MKGLWIKRVIVLLLSGLALACTLPAFAQSGELPPTQDGPYKVGAQMMHLTDANRDNRSVETTVWYPALASKDTKPPYAPDTSGAPYPLIIYSHRFQGAVPDEVSVFLINRLVSQGFIVAASDHRDTDKIHAIVDRPLDVLFVLNQLAGLKDNPLVGMINTDYVGITGASAGGHTSLQAAGARVDSGRFTHWCLTHAGGENFDSCAFLSDWDKVQAYHDQLAPPSNDDLWSATTDNRIRAILPIEPCYGQLFGEKGLATITIPTLLIAGTADQICPYDLDAAFMYAHLGSSDRYLVTADKRDHFTLVINDSDMIQQYVSAFFGLYLQGKTDYAQYLTPDSTSAFKAVTLQAQLAGQ